MSFILQIWPKMWTVDERITGRCGWHFFRHEAFKIKFQTLENYHQHGPRTWQGRYDYWVSEHHPTFNVRNKESFPRSTQSYHQLQIQLSSETAKAEKLNKLNIDISSSQFFPSQKETTARHEGPKPGRGGHGQGPRGAALGAATAELWSRRSGRRCQGGMGRWGRGSWIYVYVYIYMYALHINRP